MPPGNRGYLAFCPVRTDNYFHFLLFWDPGR
jgi:hypothetical protein